MQLKCLTLCTPLICLNCWVKRLHIEFVDLKDLIGFGYDSSDTQDGKMDLSVGE